jgi:hypothetical protein
VNVIETVTTDARNRRTLIALVDVALLTAHVTMLIMQWKIRFAMVKYRASPSTDIMATPATLT